MIEGPVVTEVPSIDLPDPPKAAGLIEGKLEKHVFCKLDARRVFQHIAGRRQAFEGPRRADEPVAAVLPIPVTMMERESMRAYPLRHQEGRRAPSRGTPPPIPRDARQRGRGP